MPRALTATPLPTVAECEPGGTRKRSKQGVDTPSVAVERGKAYRSGKTLFVLVDPGDVLI